MAEIIRIVIVNGGELTNGAAGLTGILPYTSWHVIFIFVAAITVLILNFLRSSTGRQVIAVREDEIAAEAMGVNVTKMKVMIFVMGQLSQLSLVHFMLATSERLYQKTLLS